MISTSELLLALGFLIVLGLGLTYILYGLPKPKPVSDDLVKSGDRVVFTKDHIEYGIVIRKGTHATVVSFDQYNLRTIVSVDGFPFETVVYNSYLEKV